jgi:hypothetical protein
MLCYGAQRVPGSALLEQSFALTVAAALQI